MKLKSLAERVNHRLQYAGKRRRCIYCKVDMSKGYEFTRSIVCKKCKEEEEIREDLQDYMLNNLDEIQSCISIAISNAPENAPEFLKAIRKINREIWSYVRRLSKRFNKFSPPVSQSRRVWKIRRLI